METKEINIDAIAYKRVINATIEADNSTDENRTADIIAEVVMENGKLYAINNGRVTALTTASDAEPSADTIVGHPAESPQPLATFGLNPDGSMWQQITTPGKAIEIQPEIIAFISAARAKTELGLLLKE